MITKVFRPQRISLLVLFAICAGVNGRALWATPVSPDECHEAGSLIRELRSADQRKRKRAKRSILVFADRSPGARQCVINKTLKILTEVSTSPDKGVELFWKSPGRFEEWSAAADILGTLKAGEAIDPLIDCLDCGDGRSDFGIGHYPATIAVVKFGDFAIPSLERALTQKPRGIRVMVVQALREIGGQKAKEILIRSLKTEKDPLVGDWIRNLLLGWKASNPSKT